MEIHTLAAPSLVIPVMVRPLPRLVQCTECKSYEAVDRMLESDRYFLEVRPGESCDTYLCFGCRQELIAQGSGQR